MQAIIKEDVPRSPGKPPISHNLDLQKMSCSESEISSKGLSQFSVDVSTDKPHTIISASSSLAQLLGYSTDELIGRSISTLHGPLSDVCLLESSICEVWKLDLKTFYFTIYSRTGMGYKVDVQCLPCTDADGKMIGSTLQIHLVADRERPYHSTQGHRELSPRFQLPLQTKFDINPGLLSQQGFTRAGALSIPSH